MGNVKEVVSLETTQAPVARMNSVQEIAFPDFRKKVLSDAPGIRQSIGSGMVYIVKGALPEKELRDLRKRVHQRGLTTESTFHKILEGTPNFHQVVDEIRLYKILMRSHNYHFFYWNEDPLNVFSVFSETLGLFQRINGYQPNHFVNKTPKDLLVSRFQIHHYPSGGGYMSEHSDPVKHVKTIMVTCMSRFGVDYFTEGLYLYDKENKKVSMDSRLEVGDMVLACPAIMHGCNPIDPDEKLDWASEKGRWMVLFNNLTSHCVSEG
ncbi:MAG: hypothetical protein F3745_09220 [Nitrospinae bacterium]|nr:hypothetical protein [Nitrospinota bacterium]